MNEQLKAPTGKVEGRAVKFRGAVWDATTRKPDAEERGVERLESEKRALGWRHDNSRKQASELDSGSQPPPAPPAEILVSTSGFGRLGAGATKKRRILCRRSFRCSVSCGQGAVLFSAVCPFSDAFSCLSVASPFGETVFPDAASWQSTCPSF